jgi:hypothetical protein
MNKKQFDHIEDRIREAAANSEPPFDEQAWASMEIRLNKEEKRRRFVFWWFALPVLFIAGVTVLFYYNRPAPENNPGGQRAKTTATADEHGTAVKVSDQPSASTKSIDVTVNKMLPQKDEMKINLQKANVTKEPSIIEKPASSINQIKTYSTKNNFSKPTISEQPPGSSFALNKKQKLTSQVSGGEISEQDDVAVKEQVPAVVISPMPAIINKRDTGSVFSKNSTQVKDSSKYSIAKVETVGKTKQKAPDPAMSRLYFLAAAGGEIGSVKLLAFKNNPVTLKYGAGIGYQLTKKVSVQTGFYAGTKKYIAGPGDYNAKAGSYWNMVQIVKVNAACLVYDIPVTVRYNFLQKAGVTYFATTGLSSYIMKKEDYNYYYIRYNTPHESAYSYTGNKSAFSVLNFSAGIEKKLSSALSLQLEPALSVPLSGVGDGRVKLFNAALQFGIKYQPVKKR